MAARYTHYYGPFGEHVLQGDLMRRAMLPRAEAVRDRAKATARVDEDGPHPGRYRDGFEASTPLRRLGGDARIVGRVENRTEEAIFNEFGTATNEADHTLGRALDAVAYTSGRLVNIRRFGIGGQAL